jgi:hypothetical protein
VCLNHADRLLGLDRFDEAFDDGDRERAVLAPA